MKPKRIQRKRTKGWRMPEGAVYIGRPTKWGNPFIVNEQSPVTNRTIAVSSFRAQVDIGWSPIQMAEIKPEMERQ